jgi:hypothetical protein
MGDKYTLGTHSLFLLTLLLVVTGTALCHIFVSPLAAQPFPSPPVGTPPFLSLSVEPPVILADGASTSTINASLWDGEYWLSSGPPITFSTDLGDISPSVPLIDWVATAILTAGLDPGVATITATTELIEGWVTNKTTVTIKPVEFNTGGGDYPSIAGKHTGFLKPNHTFIAEAMYAYPCPGTGGHFESVALYLASTNVEVTNATWGGYHGDFRALYFPEPITLVEGTEYRYEIVTGSYPQIIHKQSNNNSDGFINCTRFEDLNGNIYESGIPAFTLGLKEN